MGRLTTHVLDLADGLAAQGMRVRLFRLDGDVTILLAELHTNADGRCPQPLLEGAAMAAGCYRLDFYVADYFRARGTVLPEPPFLDVVALGFGVADAAAHYHVPLLVSPWSYSTYRGS